MAEPVNARRLTDQEGQQLQRIVHRGSTNAVRYRRAMMTLTSAGGNRVPVIAQLVAAGQSGEGPTACRRPTTAPTECLLPRLLLIWR